MLHQVVVLPRAKRDLLEHYQWIAERSTDGANRWVVAFENAAHRLEFDPESYGVAPESDQHSEIIRQFFFKTRRGRIYRGLFVVEQDQVFVLHIRGPGQRVMQPGEIEGI